MSYPGKESYILTSNDKKSEFPGWGIALIIIAVIIVAVIVAVIIIRRRKNLKNNLNSSVPIQYGEI